MGKKFRKFGWKPYSLSVTMCPRSRKERAAVERLLKAIGRWRSEWEEGIVRAVLASEVKKEKKKRSRPARTGSSR